MMKSMVVAIGLVLCGLFLYACVPSDTQTGKQLALAEMKKLPGPQIQATLAGNAFLMIHTPSGENMHRVVYKEDGTLYGGSPPYFMFRNSRWEVRGDTLFVLANGVEWNLDVYQVYYLRFFGQEAKFGLLMIAGVVYDGKHENQAYFRIQSKSGFSCNPGRSDRHRAGIPL